MKTFYFLYIKIGKNQSWNLWRKIEARDLADATDIGNRHYFKGDFEYEHIVTIHVSNINNSWSVRWYCFAMGNACQYVWVYFQCRFVIHILPYRGYTRFIVQVCMGKNKR